MNYNEFRIMTELESCPEKTTQRSLSLKLKLSLGTINKLLTSLSVRGYIMDMKLTADGLKALQPYRVQKAVIIAAGFGSRMVPLTFNTPKPLIRVHGVRMIDTILDAICAAGIEEIYIVRGYLGEQFDVLTKKYPRVQFLENLLYNEENNISSAFVAKSLLKNAYVLEADLVLSNPKLISKYQYCSNYLGIYKQKTDDWCFMVNKDLKITKMCVGGNDCYQMVGISYWTNEDGEKLEKDIETVYRSPGGKERYWDQVALEYCFKNYSICVRPCEQNDIVEIDSFKELKLIDKTYDI